VELVFLCFSIKASLAKMFEYFLDMPAICRYVIRKDEYIIQIDHDADIQKIGKKVIHELLKGQKSIGKTK